VVATDSAGVPWQGRSFDHGAPSDDDGSAPQPLIDAITRFRAGEAGEAVVVDAFRGSRLLIPLVAHLGESAVGDHGHSIDKSAELSIVTVAGPDGRNVMPVFSSVEAMQTWNQKARPVPADAVRVALAAASDGTELVVLDPVSVTEFVIRRPALWSIAQSRPWRPSHADAEVLGAFRSTIQGEVAVAGIELTAGDPDARLAGPELQVQLALQPGLAEDALAALLARLQVRWTANEIIATRVDSMRVALVPA
jgi:hypothetical protein